MVSPSARRGNASEPGVSLDANHTMRLDDPLDYFRPSSPRREYDGAQQLSEIAKTTAARTPASIKLLST